jgi:hypothetical protein
MLSRKNADRLKHGTQNNSPNRGNGMKRKEKGLKQQGERIQTLRVGISQSSQLSAIGLIDLALKKT